MALVELSRVLPHDPGDVAIEMDRPVCWAENEIAEARGGGRAVARP